MDIFNKLLRWTVKLLVYSFCFKLVEKTQLVVLPLGRLLLCSQEPWRGNYFNAKLISKSRIVLKSLGKLVEYPTRGLSNDTKAVSCGREQEVEGGDRLTTGESLLETKQPNKANFFVAVSTKAMKL